MWRGFLLALLVPSVALLRLAGVSRLVNDILMHLAKESSGVYHFLDCFLKD
jgi:hypothetical protein